jgi:hypothetical protein
MALLDFIAEQNRAFRAQDDKYLRSYTYFFELRVPRSVVGADGPAVFIYPLIIPPESYRMSEPFTVEKTMTNGSGLWVEESGIIARELTLSGTTGWKPRAFPKNMVSANAEGVQLPSAGRSFSRKQVFKVLEELSGQRHFQFLQDAVFRTYGDLKRDPSTAAETELFFHNPKDDEHWRVHPMSFNTSREASSQNLYKYDIVLLCSEGAEENRQSPGEDASVLDALKNANLMLHYAVSLVVGSLTDLAGVQDEIRRNIQGLGTVLDDVAAIASATSSFLSGTAQFISTGGAIVSSPLRAGNTVTRSFIQVPFAFVEETLSGMGQVLDAYHESVVLGSGVDVDGSVLNSLRRLGDGLDAIASYPDRFLPPVNSVLQQFQDRQDLSTSRTSAQLALAASSAPPQTLVSFSQLGTALLPGDAVRASDELGLGRFLPRFQSAHGRIIASGDTLANLAAQYLGDARQWKFLAVFNDLAPPYISQSGLPGTLAVGDTILIPSTAPPQEAVGVPGILGVAADASNEERVLGTDLKLVSDINGAYDWVVDLEGGSIDATLVAGVANLQQGLRSRLITEQGSDVLYKTLGVGRVVGIGLTAVDLDTARITLVSGVQADPRVAGVRRVEFQNGPPDDALFVEMDVEVRGLARSEKIVVQK